MTKESIKVIVAISVGVALFIILVSFISSGFQLNVLTNFKFIGINVFYSVTLTLVNFLFFLWLGKKYDWSSQSKIRFYVGVIGSIVLTLIAFSFCRLVHLTLLDPIYTFQEFWKHERVANYLFPFLLSALVSSLMHAIYFYKAIQENKVTEQKIIAGTASAKFDALKNQLDPHFLFNSLNVLTSLIEENPEIAQQFTTSLSKVYRYVLEQKNKDLVSVDEELAFAHTYIELLKMRFENSIEFTLPEKASNPEAKIVPLSLQLLLENAVKHNIASEEKPLQISIYEEKGRLVVKNNFQPKSVLKKSSGVGLQNIEQRYALLTSKTMEIVKKTNLFEVRLPILTKQVYLIDDNQTQEKEMTDYKRLKRVKERIETEKSFYGNLTAYCIIIPFLAFINYFVNGFAYVWFIYPLAGWGIGLTIHYYTAFNKNPFINSEWEHRKIKQFMKEDKFDYENHKQPKSFSDE